MYHRLSNIFRFNKIFWWIICCFLVLNIVFLITFREKDKNRINELHEIYNKKRNSSALKIDNSQTPLLQAIDDIKIFRERLHERKDLAETAAELFTILKKHKLDIGQTAYIPETIDNNGFYKYTTSLSIKGNYPALKALLADIQKSRTLFCIETLSVSSNTGERSVEMKVKIATYFR